MYRRHIVLWSLVTLFVAVLSFLLGSSTGQRAMLRIFSVRYDGIQAMLAFNRLDDERHWEALLKNGCTAQAMKSLAIAQDQDLELLAGFYKGQLDQDTLNYIQARDPTLLPRLKTFHSKYGNEWTEGPCKN